MTAAPKYHPTDPRVDALLEELAAERARSRRLTAQRTTDARTLAAIRETVEGQRFIGTVGRQIAAILEGTKP